MVFGLVWKTGSGSAAIATRLTVADATAPPAIPARPAVLKKLLLEFIVFPNG
jgi:hypothetical protein